MVKLCYVIKIYFYPFGSHFVPFGVKFDSCELFLASGVILYPVRVKIDSVESFLVT